MTMCCRTARRFSLLASVSQDARYPHKGRTALSHILHPPVIPSPAFVQSDAAVDVQAAIGQDARPMPR